MITKTLSSIKAGTVYRNTYPPQYAIDETSERVVLDILRYPHGYNTTSPNDEYIKVTYMTISTGEIRYTTKPAYWLVEILEE